jgi:hypothetical protein
MSFSKENLTGLYNWDSQKETSLFEGSPSRRTFDRYNGDQVVFIISKLSEKLGISSIEQAREMEKLIINRLPFTPCSELTVFNWLEKEMMAIS